MQPVPKERWRASVCVPDAEINLAEAALLIAQDEYAALDPRAYLKRLDTMAAGLRARIPASSSDAVAFVALVSKFMFEEQGYAGNGGDYYDPRNSFLNDVMDRRLGIPITLAILYLELGWRLGLPVEGVSFPGHFLVKLHGGNGDMILDPFERGALLDNAELVRRLQRIGVEADTSLGRLLEAASKREILARMLRNLKGIYQHTDQPEKVLAVLDRLLIIAPDMPAELRERAALHERLECFRAAADDYERYLALAPAAADAQEIRIRTSELRCIAARLN